VCDHIGSPVVLFSSIEQQISYKRTAILLFGDLKSTLISEYAVSNRFLCCVVPVVGGLMFICCCCRYTCTGGWVQCLGYWLHDGRALVRLSVGERFFPQPHDRLLFHPASSQTCTNKISSLHALKAYRGVKF